MLPPSGCGGSVLPVIDASFVSVYNSTTWWTNRWLRVWSGIRAPISLQLWPNYAPIMAMF